MHMKPFKYVEICIDIEIVNKNENHKKPRQSAKTEKCFE